MLIKEILAANYYVKGINLKSSCTITFLFSGLVITFYINYLSKSGIIVVVSQGICNRRRFFSCKYNCG